MNTELMFSKKSDEWETPLDLFDKLNKIYNFSLDPASTDENHLCDKYFTKEQDGLKQDWSKDVIFLNPPFSKIKLWMKKAYEESLKGAKVICLIPARVDTKYWFDFCLKANLIYFIKGRLRFVNRKLPLYNPFGNFKISPAPFPSVIVVFDLTKKVGDTIFETWKGI